MLHSGEEIMGVVIIMLAVPVCWIMLFVGFVIGIHFGIHRPGHKMVRLLAPSRDNPACKSCAHRQYCSKTDQNRLIHRDQNLHEMH